MFRIDDGPKHHVVNPPNLALITVVGYLRVNTRTRLDALTTPPPKEKKNSMMRPYAALYYAPTTQEELHAIGGYSNGSYFAHSDWLRSCTLDVNTRNAYAWTRRLNGPHIPVQIGLSIISGSTNLLCIYSRSKSRSKPQHPSRPRQPTIEWFRPQHPSRPNQPRVLPATPSEL